MANDKKKEIQTKANQDIQQPPDWMQEYRQEGLELVGPGDFEIPRIKLIQALSPEIEERDDLRPGDFYHNVLEVPLGNSVRIVPVFVDQRFILWRPRDDGGGILARADDGKHWDPPNGEFKVTVNGKKVVWKLAPTVRESGLADWGSSDPEDSTSEPAATKMYSIVCWLPDYPSLSPAVVTLQRTSIKVARRFLGKLNMSRAPSYGMYFRMQSVDDQNQTGQKFKNFRFTSEGFVQDKEEFEAYRDTYQFFYEQGVNIRDLESAQEEEDVTSSTEGKTEHETPSF